MRFLIFVLSFFSAFCTLAQKQKPLLKGILFEDVNRNGKKDVGEKGLPQVCISNGIDVLKTNKKGFFEIELIEGQTFFVIKPSGYSLPKDEFNVSSAFFHYYPNNPEKLYAETISQTAEIPKELHIPLYKNEESSSFSMAMIGDTQARFQRQVNYAHEIAEELLLEDLEGAAILGDIGDDNAMIFPAFQQLFKQFGTRVYPVPGNHDRNYDSEEKHNEFNSFKLAFGPDHYAFNIGKVHFIVMNDVTTIEGIRYTDIIPENNLKFIENNLKHIAKDQLIVFLQHIPIDHLKPESKSKFLKLIEGYSNVVAFSGHMHKMTHNFIPYGENDELREVVVGAACGLWWGGEFNEKGLPSGLMGDGAPRGYYLAHFSDDKVELDFKALGKPKTEQMHVWLYQKENAISDPTMLPLEGITENQFVVNVWSGSERTKVLARIDKGEWFELERTDKIVDPFVKRAFVLDSLSLSNHKSFLKNAKNPNMPSHIWIGDFPQNLKDGSHIIEVKATDDLGINLKGIKVFTKGNFDGNYQDVNWYN